MRKVFLGLMFSLACLGTISKIHAQNVTTIAGPAKNVDDALLLRSDGTLLGSNYDGSAVFRITLTGEVTVHANGFNTPNGLAFDSQGNLFLADNRGNKIYKIKPDGTIAQHGANIISPSGLIKDPNSDTLLVTQFGQSRVLKMAPDGTLKTYLTGNGLNGPVGLAFDEENNLYIGNFNDCEIYKVTPSGTMSLLADIPGTWLGFITYSAGKIYGTSFTLHKIYAVTREGVVTHFAGTGAPGNADGPALSASFNNPNGIIATATGDTIFISDYGSKSVRMITGATVSVAEQSAQSPVDFQLEQNYPNPLTAENASNSGALQTVIPFSLRRAQHVTLKVYDNTGREIATLWEGIKPAGAHRVRFDTAALPSGVYFYKLQAGGVMASRKMVLMRGGRI